MRTLKSKDLPNFSFRIQNSIIIFRTGHISVFWKYLTVSSFLTKLQSVLEINIQETSKSHQAVVKDKTYSQRAMLVLYDCLMWFTRFLSVKDKTCPLRLPDLIYSFPEWLFSGQIVPQDTYGPVMGLLGITWSICDLEWPIVLLVFFYAYQSFW